MQCNEIMKSDVKRAAQGDSLQQVAKVMADSNVGFMPVCDDNGVVVGTITDRDIVVRGVAAGVALGTPVGRLMSQGIIACGPEDEVERAATLMAQNKKSRIVCVDDNKKLIGVISWSDVTKARPVAATQTTKGEARPS